MAWFDVIENWLKKPVITKSNDLQGYDQNEILWNGLISKKDTRGWSARDINGNPLTNSEGKRRIWGLGDTGSGSFPRGNTGLYSYDSKAVNINELPWYNFITSTYSDSEENPTSHGQNWLKLYIRFSKEDLPFKKELQDYVNRGFKQWKPITRGGKTFRTFGLFAKDVYTRLLGLGHNTDSGILPYYIDEDGNKRVGRIDFTNYEQTIVPLNEQLEGTNVNLVGYRRKPTSFIDDVLDKLDGNKTPISGIPKENIQDTSLKAVKTKVSEMNGALPPDGGGGGGGDDEGDKSSNSGGIRGPFNPTILDAMRLAADNLFNIRNTNKYKEALRPTLENYSPSYKQPHGDYIAQQQAENAAANLRNRTSLTSNAQTQTASDLEAIAKGNQYIQQGQAKDALTYWLTSEQAFQQSKENTLGWQNVANRNYKSLTDYNNKLAELDYQANKDNMQNIDKFIAELSKRLWDKYDLYEYKRMQAEELNNEAYDKYYGNAGDYELVKELTNKLDEALVKSLTGATQEEKNNYASQATILRRLLDLLSNKIAALTYINRLRRYSPNDWNNTFNTLYGGKYTIGADNIINGFDSKYRTKLSELEVDVSALEKLFGWNNNTSNLQESTLPRSGRRLQSGGSFGVTYTSVAGGGNPYLQALLGKGSTSKKKADYSSSDSSSNKDDDNSKLKDKLLNGIADTLKGIDGLNSDVNVLYGELSRFFDLQLYNLNDDPMQFYSMYIKALNRVNLVKQSAKLFDNAYKAMEKSGSITSPAIDSNGYVYVGVAGTNQIDKISPIEYIQNKKKYKLLRNNELLELRRNSSNYAFADSYITEVAYNGTSIQEVSKFIKEILGKVGTDQESRDMIVRQYGQNAIEGLQQLQYLALNQFATGETAAVIANLKGALSELNLTTKSQVQLAELGIKTIIAMMPANMRTLLMIQGDSPNSVEKLVAGYVFSGLDNSIDFKFKDVTTLDVNGNPTGSSKSGSSSSGNDPKESTASKWIHGYGEKTTFMITTGTDKGWVVTGNTLPLTDSSDHKIGQSTLADATKAFGGVLDLQHAFMGNQRISSLALSLILVETGDITMVALPVNTDDGYNRPAFERLKKLSDADARLKLMNIDITLKEQLSQEQKQKVNEVYRDFELPPLFNEDGSINLVKYAYFGLVKGMTTGDTFEEGSEFTRDYLIKASSQERKLFEKAMQALGNKKFSIDDGWLGGIFGGDDVYRGTIFIPIRTNVINAQSGYGSTYSGTPQLNLSWDTALLYTDELKSNGGAKKLGKTNFDIQ